MIFENAFFPALILWSIVVIIHYFRHGFLKYKKFGFSVKNYYIMLLPFVFGVMWDSHRSNSYRPIVIFLLLAIAGVIGETIVSKWWQIFFGQRFWVYKVETLYHGYTSWLNFIPWAVGGMLYISIINQLTKQSSYPAIEFAILTLISALIILQVILFELLKPSHNFKFHQITWQSFLVFFSPIIILLAVLAYLYGSSIWVIAAYFGVIATTAEYLFGKACHFFISRKLWDYIYLAHDRGHFTPLSIPLFILGGFYFWAIARIINLILMN